MAKASSKPTRRLRMLKQVRICALCGGYMKPKSAMSAAQVGSQAFHNPTQHRSFGGQCLKYFACESCGHNETFQVDEFSMLKEDKEEKEEDI